MTLLDDLARARTEEDVKDAYIKALGLKGYSKNLVDIQTEEIWFEAKDAPKPSIEMFAQLLFYIRAARKRGEAVPSFLAVKHSNLRNVFMSTLDQADVTIMKSNPAFAGAEIFQYDYLNDDVSDFGEIDYSLSNKVPPALRQAIADARERKKGAKPIVVLINPPYAESGSSSGRTTGGIPKAT